MKLVAAEAEVALQPDTEQVEKLEAKVAALEKKLKE